MSSSLPPDLRVLCRKLTSIAPAQLPHALPALINHVLRCGEPLSAPQDQKLRDSAPESAVLVHNLKTSIGALLHGRSREGRFVAVGLVKAVVDVGGWEVLRGSEKWVQGLLSIVQKSDPAPAKELAIVTLARIYTLVQPYQTLVREIATPTIPAFITACLQLVKSSAGTPLYIVETVCDAVSTLVPLYPTTFRPSTSQIRNAVRPYLAPTSTDGTIIPDSLQHAARRAVVSLHQVAAKSGGSDDWYKLVDGLLKDFHATANQVFRAVDESWEATSGHGRSTVALDGEPHGGGASTEDLPPWTGVEAGAERLIGLLDFISDCLRYPTKAAVTVPINAFTDAVTRVCLIARLSPKTQSWDQALQTNPAIGREEKDELWSVVPGIHVSAMRLMTAMVSRFGSELQPLVPESQDHLVRVFRSGMSVAEVRETGYEVLGSLLDVAGPTMSKQQVDMLGPVIGACCRDLQQDAGYLKHTAEKSSSSGASNDRTKKNGMTVNADLFLKPQSDSTAADGPNSRRLSPDHKAAADALLAKLLSSAPQQHLKPTMRGLLDKTAILTRNRDAMVASVLNPYRDQRGRTYPSILPHLARLFPHDQALEVLRSNLRTASAPAGENDELPALEEMSEEDDDDDEAREADETEMRDADAAADGSAAQAASQAWQPPSMPAAPKVESELPIQQNPFKPQSPDSATVYGAPAKRKHPSPDAASSPSKRHERQEPPIAPDTTTPRTENFVVTETREGEEEEDDDSDGSVHLNMELDDDDEEDEEDD